MMCVIPQLDHWARQLFLVAHRTQACSAQHEPAGVGRHFKSNPARREDPNEMSAGKNQHVTLDCAYTFDRAVRPCADLARRFSARAAITKQLPIRALPVNVST